MRRPRREPWSFWCVLKCSVNCPIRSLSKAICTSGLPVSLGCVPYWSMRDFLCSLANTCLVHSCLISIVVCDVYRVPRRVVDRKGSTVKDDAPFPRHPLPAASQFRGVIL